jgi:hypothetical protein
MRARLAVVAVGLGLLGTFAAAQQPTPHLNPMVDVLAAKKPIFGLSQPSNGRGGGGGRGGNRGGAAGAGAAGATATPTPTPETPPPPPPPQKTPLELAKDALAHPESDYLFNGNMEGGVDRGLEAFTTFHAALVEAGGAATTPYPHLKAPFAVKTPIVRPIPRGVENIGRQLTQA